jgi:hypothetical protein
MSCRLGLKDLRPGIILLIRLLQVASSDVGVYLWDLDVHIPLVNAWQSYVLRCAVTLGC